MRRRRFGLTALPWMAGVVLAVVACGGGKASESTDTPTSETQSSLMRRATSCDDLTRALQSDITERVQIAVRTQSPYYTVGGIDMTPGSGFGGSATWSSGGSAGMTAGSGGMSFGAGGSMGIAGSFSMGGSAGSAGVFVSTGGSTGVAGGLVSTGGSGGGGGGAGAPTSFTQTNTQVAGVDEADFVKTDGTNLYVVRDQTLHVVTAWPLQALAERTKAAIEGRAFELYVVGAVGSAQKIVVYSTVDGTSMYELAGVTPPSISGYASTAVDTTAPGYYPWSNPLTKATVLTFAGGALSVESEVYFEGSYVSSRRTGERVRTVLELQRSAPGLRMYSMGDDQHRADLLVLERLQRMGRSVADLTSDEFQAMYDTALQDVIAADNKAAIATITADAWVPHVFWKQNAGASAVAVPMPCDDFYIPKSGGGSLGVTYVADIDLTKLGASPQGIAILGTADTMYQNGTTLVLTALDWAAGGGTFVTPHTFVHRFDYSDQEPLTYSASGLITGEIHDQFSIDEKDGNVRVVTSENGASGRQSHLYVLRAVGPVLKTIGDAGVFAQNEQVTSARFVGDKGYVVTFRQVDPLFVFDLADPAKPALLGELTIPGFSEYMHPLDDGHLLTVGQSGSGNVALKLFDVTDPKNPKAMPGAYTFTRFGTTEASVTHKAVTYYADADGGLLALPFSGSMYTAATGYGTPVSSLELFRVSLSNGIQSKGGVPGTLLIPVDDPNVYCDAYLKEEGARFQRGQFIDTIVYGVARDGIVASDMSKPETVLASLKLGNTCVDGYTPLMGGGGAVGGMAGMGGSWGISGGAGGAWIEFGGSGGVSGVGGAFPETGGMGGGAAGAGGIGGDIGGAAGGGAVVNVGGAVGTAGAGGSAGVVVVDGGPAGGGAAGAGGVAGN
jgi:hypothetical protein